MSECVREQCGPFLAGALDGLDEEAFIAHLDVCRPCREYLESAASNEDLWKSARDVLRPTGVETGSIPAVAGSNVEAQSAVELSADPVTPAADAGTLSFLAPSDDPAMAGRLGSYEIIGLLGRGGMGIVLKGFDRSLHRDVAIKVLDPGLATSSAARQRFAREARAMAAVSHEHVVPVFAVDQAGGLPYVVMEYVAGGTLEKRLAERGTLDTVEVVRVGLQVAQALAAAHRQGLVHRDIKPSNILLDRGIERVRVADFGLARAADDTICTRTGQVAGTPQYMSPEQVRGEPCDARSDLFSLGSVLYALCAGRAPFHAETLYGTMQRIAHAEPRGLRDQNANLAAWLEDFIFKLLAKDPARRFATADEVAQVLEAELACLQNPRDFAEPARGWRRFRKALAGRRGPAATVMPDAKSRRVSPGTLGLLVLVVALVGVLIAVLGNLPARKDGGTETNSQSDDSVDQSARLNDGPTPAPGQRGSGVPEPNANPDAVPAPPLGNTVPRAEQFLDAPIPREVRRYEGHRGPVRGLVWDPAHDRLISSSGWPKGDGTIRLWGKAEDEPAREIVVSADGALDIDALAITPKGDRILAGLSDGTLRVFDPTTGDELMHARAHEQAITSLAVSLDGARWASASLDGGVALWDDKSDKPAYRVAAHENWCRAVAFAPNGRFLASGGLDSVVHVWNVQTVEGRAPLLSGSKDFPILHGQKEVWTVAFINDGKTILAGGNGVTAWDTSTKSHRWYLNGHAERVTDLTISPDQKKMATCSFDGTFCVWDVETQKVLYRGHAGVGSLWKVLFTPDSRQLLTGGGGSVVEGEWQPGDDFTIRVWAVK